MTYTAGRGRGKWREGGREGEGGRGREREKKLLRIGQSSDKLHEPLCFCFFLMVLTVRFFPFFQSILHLVGGGEGGRGGREVSGVHTVHAHVHSPSAHAQLQVRHVLSLLHTATFLHSSGVHLTSPSLPLPLPPPPSPITRGDAGSLKAERVLLLHLTAHVVALAQD